LVPICCKIEKKENSALVREDWDEPINDLTIVVIQQVVRLNWVEITADFCVKWEALLDFFLKKTSKTTRIDMLVVNALRGVEPQVI